ncbi:O-antigen ligase family protein [Luteolibacter ambystomatis]|uniref:O-antigen ligase family protein n=1 Tax=Luteolibacter ambystomatis TaxID=2824561 RepID=A0A975IZT8_9BACT|nr:O-antigen ligase family protein [Luteolibacter ambystomatis]QUE50205.1 O-antigen ligase family protein [Luteolibacter ambystomatis]
MKSGVISAILLSLALAVALAFAPSLEPTAPGMVLLMLAPALVTGAFALPSSKRPVFLALLVFGAVGYAAWRAATSPVIDFGRSDLLLIGCGVAGCFWAGWLANRRSHGVMVVGLAVLAMANLVVALVQWHDPGFTPFFAGRKTASYPSGFYAHYNHFANFLLAAGFVACGRALVGGSGRRIRIAWAVVALACAGGIALSNSRGAWIASAAGLLVLLIGWLLDLKRRRAKSFGLAVVGVVVALPLLGFGGWHLARQMLAHRGVAANSARMLDDSGRLNFASMAIDIASNQPSTGGGSRSFSYEVFKHWDPQQLWVGSGDIDFVHNELLQTATDYGWIGLAVVVAMLVLVGLRGLLVLAVEPEKDSPGPDAGLTIGAMAAIVAVLGQSMFSFVFHMAPDVIVLGLLIGIVVAQPWPFSKPGTRPSPWMRPAPWVACGLAVGLVTLGWRDAAAWWISARPGSDGLVNIVPVRYAALSRAAEIRPDSRLDRDAAGMAARMSESEAPPASGEWADKAYRHLQIAVSRNPHDYAARLSMARVLDEFGQFPAAEEQYRVLLPLLDLREIYYRARFAYGSHSFRQANALFHARRTAEALAWAIEARNQMEVSLKHCWFPEQSPEGIELARVRNFIKWLEDARYTPAPDAVPPSP